jgi:hypothetical protein
MYRQSVSMFEIHLLLFHKIVWKKTGTHENMQGDNFFGAQHFRNGKHRTV